MENVTVNLILAIKWEMLLPHEMIYDCAMFMIRLYNEKDSQQKKIMRMRTYVILRERLRESERK